MCQVSSHPNQGFSFYHANIHTHIHTHTHCEKVITISVPPYYYIVRMDTAITFSQCVCVCVGMCVGVVAVTEVDPVCWSTV